MKERVLSFASVMGVVKHHLFACCLIVCAILLRLFFIAHVWPATDSEEGTMALEAWHILARGEHPIYLYGQSYMGVVEAYLGAVMFWLRGISINSLRLGMLLFDTIFLVLIYLLARLLYSQRTALWTLLFLVGGSVTLIIEELKAVGGAVETIVCGSALFLIASKIVLRDDVSGAALSATADDAVDSTTQVRSKRLWWAYAAWGIVAGLGLWSHMLIAPFVLTSALLLFFGSARGQWRRYWLPAVLGFLVGALPVILYDIMDPRNNNIIVLWNQHNTSYQNAPTGIMLWLKQGVGTFLYTLPVATGFAHFFDLPTRPFFSQIFGDSAQGTLPFYWKAGAVPWPATIINIFLYGGWSLCYLLVLGRSLWTTFKISDLPYRLRARITAWRQHLPYQKVLLDMGTPLRTYEQRLALARCMLLLAGGLTILSYCSSATAAEKPWSYRYLIGLLVVLPAMLDPFVRRFQYPQRSSNVTVSHHSSVRAALVSARTELWWPILSRISLIVMIVVSILAISSNFVFLPRAYADEAEHAAMVARLQQLGITRVYSGYWICDRLIFASHERVICAAVKDKPSPGQKPGPRLVRYHLWPDLTRYTAYETIVDSAPHAAYIFTTSNTILSNPFVSQQAMDDLAHDRHYARITVGHYIIFYWREV